MSSIFHKIKDKENALVFINEALVCVRKIEDLGDFEKSNFLKEISSQLFIQGDTNQSLLILKEALLFADLKNILSFFIEFSKQNRIEEAFTIMQGYYADNILIEIAIELIVQGYYENFHYIINSFWDDDQKNIIYLKI